VSNVIVLLSEIAKNIKIPLHLMSISVQSLSTHQRQQVVSFRRNGNSRRGLHIIESLFFDGHVTLFVLCVYKKEFFLFYFTTVHKEWQLAKAKRNRLLNSMCPISELLPML
jgi:hypothetical protein